MDTESIMDYYDSNGNPKKCKETTLGSERVVSAKSVAENFLRVLKMKLRTKLPKDKTRG